MKTYISKELLSYIYMPIIVNIYLIINFILLKTNNYCNTTGCGLTKNLLNIDQSYLYILSISGFSFLLILGYLSLFKKINFSGITNEILLKIFSISLFCIVSIESIFISYLYIYTEQMCIVCMFFYILILIHLLLVTFLNHKFEYLLIILSIIIALSLIKYNKESNLVINKTILLVENINNNYEIETKLKDNNVKFTKEDYKNYLSIINNFELDNLPILIYKDKDNNVFILNNESKILNQLTK